MSTRPLLTHTPGDGGPFGGVSLCGMDVNSTSTGSIRISETFADCAVCLDLQTRNEVK